MCLSADLAVIPAWMGFPGTHLADDPEKPNRQHFMSHLSFCPKGSLPLVWLGSGSTTPWGSGVKVGAPRRLGLERCSEECVSKRGCAEALRVPFVMGTIASFLLSPTRLCSGMRKSTFFKPVSIWETNKKPLKISYLGILLIFYLHLLSHFHVWILALTLLAGKAFSTCFDV